jgi:hypothetical protein
MKSQGKLFVLATTAILITTALAAAMMITITAFDVDAKPKGSVPSSRCMDGPAELVK